jgi:hypothetical protein
MSTAHTAPIPPITTFCLGAVPASTPKPSDIEHWGAHEHDNLAGNSRQKTYNSTILLKNRTSNLAIFGQRYQKRHFPPQLTFTPPHSGLRTQDSALSHPATLSPCPLPHYDSPTSRLDDLTTSRRNALTRSHMPKPLPSLLAALTLFLSLAPTPPAHTPHPNARHNKTKNQQTLPQAKI